MLAMLLVGCLGVGHALEPSPSVSPTAIKPPQLHVSGTQLVNSSNVRVRLKGVNICSLEWTATGDHLLESIGVAIDQWHANIIRLPLSQDRWFGKTADSQDGGVAYRALVDQAVAKIRDRGAYSILDLHWSDGGVWGQNMGQHALPDAHSLEFWKSCAAIYANDSSVIFDLYNEPFGAPWSVWRDGGTVSEKFQGKDLSYQAVGLQTLLDAIRSTGAKNVVHAGGLGYSSRLDFPAAALLSDPSGEGVVYVSHFYPGWENVTSWQARIEKAAKRLPLFVEEFGDDSPSAPMDTPDHRIGQIFAVLNKNEFNWTAWCMHPAAHPCLIRDWSYQPTFEFGTLVKMALAGKSVPIAPRRVVSNDIAVYDGKLESPWESWGSAKVDFISPEPGHLSPNSMSVNLGPYQQVQLGTVPFDALAFKSISFWIKASSGSKINLTLFASVMDTPKPALKLPQVGDQWTNISVLFADLGIKNLEDVKSFTLRNSDGSVSSSFFLDRIQIYGNRYPRE